jgi:hypothetical protein
MCLQVNIKFNLVFYANDGTYLIGYPKRQTVQNLIANI